MCDRVYTRLIWSLFNKSFKKQIAKIFDKEFAKAVIRRAKPEYFKMVCEMPSLGKNNPKLIDILVTALVASVYKSGDGKITPKQMDVILTDGMESVYIFRKFSGMKDHFTKEWQDNRNAESIESQKKKYPADFVSEFIYGKSVNEYGIRYYECAIYKLLKREDCVELVPLMCKFDYVMAKYINAELKRNKTLATGADFCDFWYTKKQ